MIGARGTDGRPCHNGGTGMYPARIYPFRDGDTFSTFQNHLKQVLQEIDGLDNDYVLKASPTELEAFYIDKALITPLCLHADQYHIEGQRGVHIDVSADFARGLDPGERAHVRGTQLEIAIPYEGDPTLWKIRPNPCSVSGYPEIHVHNDRVVFTVSFPDDSPDARKLKDRIDSDVQTLASAITSQEKNIAGYNADVPQRVKEQLASKRAKAAAATSAVAGLGIPMKRRAQPPTYAVPITRRKTLVQRPPAQAGKYEPEPTLQESECEHILSVLRSMALVIERNPDSFKLLHEEPIRDCFLLILNGHYEGTATGETFNGEGKTDILIRVENRNIFIAECKFWEGSKKFGDAIDQLLGYLTWRDCRCALLVFNRNKDTAGVAQKMHQVMQERPEHRKTVTHDPNGNSRYILVKTEEPGREIVITTMIFDVPTN